MEVVRFPQLCSVEDAPKELRQEALPPEGEWAEGQTHIANNKWTLHERNTGVLADLLCKDITTVVVVLLHIDMRDELTVTVKPRKRSSSEK